MHEWRKVMLLAGLGLTLNVVAAEADSGLQVNPFLKPAFLVAAEPVNAPAEKQDTVSLELRATMVAGRMSQANIGGKIIGLGEDVNGYRLLEVHVRHVVLERDGTHKEIIIADGNTAGRE